MRPRVVPQVLLVVAATHLDAVAFQIFSQSFKLVPTALFAYWLLGQMLEPMQVRHRSIWSTRLAPPSERPPARGCAPAGGCTRMPPP